LQKAAGVRLKQGWDILQSARATLKNLSDEDIVRLLTASARYVVLTPSLRASDFRGNKPSSLADGRKAVDLATGLTETRDGKQLLAQAQGWTGCAIFWYSLSLDPKNQDVEALQSEAARLLAAALAHDDPPHDAGSGKKRVSPDAYRWAQALGLIRARDFNRAKNKLDRETLRKQSCEFFARADKLCEVPGEQTEIHAQWDEMYRQKP
jgi:hypothetical protein